MYHLHKMAYRKPCVNNPAFTYTGTEQSPLRFGLTAEGYPLNSVLEGYDKKLWVVEVKNNKKVWIRKDDSFQISMLTREEPVITTSCNISTIPEEDVIDNDDIDRVPSVPSVPEVPEVEEPKIEKKTTDYNIFLPYRLKQLNALDGNKDKKANFAKALAEWKIIKNKPEELKKILDEAKQMKAEPIVKACKIKK